MDSQTGAFAMAITALCITSNATRGKKVHYFNLVKYFAHRVQLADVMVHF